MSHDSPDSLDSIRSSLEARILLHLKQQKIDQKISELVRASYDEAMRTEKIVLSRAERDRLQQLVLKDFLAGMVTNI